MGVMYDAVEPANIPASQDGGPALRISVLANPDGCAFDLEAGNAPATEVVAAIKKRLPAGLASVGYVNEDTFHELEAAMGPAGMTWMDAREWPTPGLYIWAADPSGNIAKGTWALPVTPLAVQDNYAGPYDTSRTVDNFPATAAGYIDGPRSQWPEAAWARFTELHNGGPVTTPAPPAPPKPPAPPAAPSEVDVQLPILSQGNQGAPVKVVQRLIGGLAEDGIFGPLTHQAVVDFQRAHQLQEDGVVGKHTWGTLLGAPQ